MEAFDEETEELVTKLLGVAIAIALLVIVVSAIAPIGTSDAYTEFYVLGPNGTASEYPDNVSINESATVRVGVRNFERRSQTYTLVIRTNETTLNTREITLNRAEEWEELVRFSFDSQGTKHLRLELYKEQATDGEPYRGLRLFIEVRRSESEGGTGFSPTRRLARGYDGAASG